MTSPYLKVSDAPAAPNALLSSVCALARIALSAEMFEASAVTAMASMNLLADDPAGKTGTFWAGVSAALTTDCWSGVS